MSSTAYLACDLGAGSGRVMLGTLEGETLTLRELHRFPNEPVRIAGTLRWDALRLFAELKTGLRRAAETGRDIASVSVDSWGLDYVLIGPREPMLSLPYHYRDPRTDGPWERALRDPGRETIFAETGIQFMPINTLYQFIAETEGNRELLAAASHFLLIADYFLWLFSGRVCVEESLASTTQIYHPVQRDWSARLIEQFGFPRQLFPPVVPSGTPLGPLLPEVREETGLPAIEVIATCSHDTGAAVAAVPAQGDDWAYLSSGTWSLIGVELPAPLLTADALAHNFTNELGYGGTVRLLKNIAGMWLLQECQRTWQRQGGEIAYETLMQQAAEAEPFRSLIHPNAPRFARPGDMPERIAAACRETGQPVPETPGQYTRCILESLALLYGATLRELETLTGRPLRRLHIVGGGSQSTLLNQLAADATGCRVLAGPVEATAMGNVLIQALALGHLTSLAQAREVVRRSVQVQEYAPAPQGDWEEARARFAGLTGPT